MLIPGNEVEGELSYSSCPKCGVVIKDDMEYCGECGADLQQKCPGCGKRIRWHHKHCPKCGVNIAERREELAAEAERLREEARLAEEKLKAEAARRAKEREDQLQALRSKIEALHLRRRQWWERHWWKVVAGVVIPGSVFGIPSYLNSDLYAYRQAERLYATSDMAGAAEAFSALGAYSDSYERSCAIRYEMAEALYASGDFSGAVAAHEELGDYSDSRERSNAIRYEMAEELYASGDFSGAVAAFLSLGDYGDSHSRALETRFQRDGVNIRDCVTCLEWRVGPDTDTDWYEADTWVDGLGEGWRMPSLSELQQLYDVGFNYFYWGPFENGGTFIWSSALQGTWSAFGVSFNGGDFEWAYLDFDNDARAFAVREAR